MKKLTVKTQNPYEIIIERGTLDRCGEIASAVSKAKIAAVVADSNVAPLYLKRVTASLEKAGFKAVSFVFEAGEKSKNLGTLAEILSFFATNSLTRSDIAVALGGGVTGDLTGFAAAVYMRGIDFIGIPTSLLAQIDSSVGGKTGADLPEGKNLCGAFHQPRAVIIDPDVLKTLPQSFFSDGMAEAVKYGCIKDEKLFSLIENGIDDKNLEEMIYTCVDIKRQVVERDEKEKGERMLLNFGHTLGHAAELESGFSLTHGEAVGIGMVLALKAGEKKGLTEKGTAEKTEKLLKQYKLPVSCNIPLETLCRRALSDKKKTGDTMNFILIDKIGSGFTEKISAEKLYDFVK